MLHLFVHVSHIFAEEGLVAVLAVVLDCLSLCQQSTRPEQGMVDIKETETFPSPFVLEGSWDGNRSMVGRSRSGSSTGLDVVKLAPASTVIVVL